MRTSGHGDHPDHRDHHAARARSTPTSATSPPPTSGTRAPSRRGASRATGGVGTEYHNTSKFLGRKTELVYTIKELVPDQRIVLEGNNKTVRATDTMTLTATPTGGTRVVYNADFDFKGVVGKVAPVLSPLLAPAFKKLGDEAEVGMKRRAGQAVSSTSARSTALLDRSVVLGYSKVGLAVRRRLGRLAGRPAGRLPRRQGRRRHRRLVGAGHRHRPGSRRARRAGAPRRPRHREGRAGAGRAGPRGARRRPSSCGGATSPTSTTYAASPPTFADAVPALAGIVHNAGAMPPERTDVRAGPRDDDGAARPRSAADDRAAAWPRWRPGAAGSSW